MFPFTFGPNDSLGLYSISSKIHSEELTVWTMITVRLAMAFFIWYLLLTYSECTAEIEQGSRINDKPHDELVLENF